MKRWIVLVVGVYLVSVSVLAIPLSVFLGEADLGFFSFVYSFRIFGGIN